MIYYMVRHRESCEFMPQMRKGKGYTHWNPSNPYKKVKNQLPMPRIFSTLKMARRVCTQWTNMPNARMTYKTSFYDEVIDDLDIKNDNRKIEDLEIVEVEIIETKILVSRMAE